MSSRQDTFSFIHIIGFIWRNKWILIAVGLVAALAAAIFSGPAFITPKYKAEAEFYPTTINSIGNAFFTDLTQREQDVLAFGEEEQAEYALQLLQSSALIGRIIHNYNLMEHYEISEESNQPKTDLNRKIQKNISFKRTRGLSVKIEVMDEDPVMAARIANGIANIYDTVKTEVQQQVALEALEVVESEFKKKEKEVWEIRMKLKELADMGITNYDEQSRAISEEIYKLKSKGVNLKVLKDLQEQQALLAKYAGEFTYYDETLQLELEELSKLRKRYEKAKVDVEKTITHKFMITTADVPEIKAWPIRSLVTVGIAAMAVFLALIFMLIRHQLKEQL
jgi:uncharacterized protein involved in exopolysaccharide biosynthesis